MNPATFINGVKTDKLPTTTVIKKAKIIKQKSFGIRRIVTFFRVSKPVSSRCLKKKQRRSCVHPYILFSSA